jgi:hypothetical protein
MSGYEELLEAIDKALDVSSETACGQVLVRVRAVQVAIGTATDETEAGRSAEWLRRRTKDSLTTGHLDHTSHMRHHSGEQS